MNLSRTLVALGLDHDRLCAVGAVGGGGGGEVKGWAGAAMPAGVGARGGAAAAGGRSERRGLSSAGVAALLAGVAQRHSGPIMGVAVGSRAVEFVVIEDGQMGFARSADLGAADAGEGGLAQRTAVEAKRTW